MSDKIRRVRILAEQVAREELGFESMLKDTQLRYRLQEGIGSQKGKYRVIILDIKGNPWETVTADSRWEACKEAITAAMRKVIRTNTSPGYPFKMGAGWHTPGEQY